MRALRSCLVASLSLALTASLVPIAQARPSAVIPRTLAPRTSSAPRALPGVLLVTMKGKPTADKLTRVYASADTSAGAVQVVRGEQLRWRVPKGQGERQFIGKLKASGEIQTAEPDYLLEPAYLPPAYGAGPNDPDFIAPGTWSFLNSFNVGAPYTRSWWLRSMNAPAAWQDGLTGAAIQGKYPLRAAGDAIKVGVVDSGFWKTHPERGSNILEGWDFFQSYSSVTDKFTQDGDVTPVDPSSINSAYESVRVSEASHGTCLAGEIAAAANNGVGTLGVGFDTQVVVYKVEGIWTEGGDPGDGTVLPPGSAFMDSGQAAAAIRRAADDGCKVINLSFVGPPETAMQSAIDYAYGRGCIIVAAAGNDHGAPVSFPASANHVIAVGAEDLDGSGHVIRAEFSNFGSALDLSAPGTSVWGLTMPGYDPDGSANAYLPGYSWWDGTSMATPAVAGALAYLWRAAPSLTNDEITQLAESTAVDLGTPGRDDTFGYGSIDLAAAYAKLETDYPLLGNPTVSVPATTTARTIHASWTAVPDNARGVTFDVALDGSAVLTNTSAASTDLPNVANGPHTLEVTPHSRYDWEDGTASTTVSFSVESTQPVWTGSGAEVSGSTQVNTAYLGSVAIRGSLTQWDGTPLSGAPVTLQSSSDGATFADVGGALVTDLGGGEYRAVVTPGSTTWYRFALPASAYGEASASGSVKIMPAAKVGTPYASSTQRAARNFNVTGTFLPRRSNTSRLLLISLTKHKGTKWVGYGTYWAKGTSAATFSRYTRTLKLSKGSYRIYARFSGDSRNRAAAAPHYRSIVVR